MFILTIFIVFQTDNNALIERIDQLEAENTKLKEEIATLKAELTKKDEALNFLSKEQQKFAIVKRSSIKSWSQEGIIQALKLRFALGKFGYEFLRSTG